MRKWVIKTLFKWSASRSDTRLGRLLHRFAIVEADSAWQMLQAMEEVEDPQYRAELFNNALEEVHHSYLFNQAAHQYADSPFADDYHQRKQILGEGKELLTFKVEHYLGEKDVYEQFLNYAYAAPHQQIKDLFMEIRGDEEEHQRRARIQLLEELGSEGKLRKKIFSVRFKGLYKHWIALGKAMGAVSFTILLTAFYLIGGVFFRSYSRRKLNDPQLPALLEKLNPQQQAS